MRIPRAVVRVLISCLVVAACSPPSGELPEGHAAAIRDSVSAFLADWSAGEEEGDWQALLDRYADDARFVWTEDGRVRYRSVAEVRDGLQELGRSFSGMTTEFVDPVVTPLAPGLANVTTRFRTTLRSAETPAVTFGGAMTMTLVRENEGWRILQGHTSSERVREWEGGSG